MMNPHYTQLQIKEALENMQGFIDIGHDDVSELIYSVIYVDDDCFKIVILNG
jgi:hypothetical protein